MALPRPCAHNVRMVGAFALKVLKLECHADLAQDLQR